MSPLQYFQNDYDKLNFSVSNDDWDNPCAGSGYLEQMKSCVQWVSPALENPSVRLELVEFQILDIFAHSNFNVGRVSPLTYL